MKWKRSNLIICAVMVVVCAALLMIPDGHLNESSLIPRAQVRVDSVDNSALYPIGIVYTGVQACTVTVLGGPQQGRTAVASNYLNSALDKDKLFRAGDVAYAMVQPSDGALTVTLIDHYRADTELWLFVALAFALMIFGGLIGVGTMISLGASFIIIWKLMIPLLMDLVDPIIASFVMVLVLTGIIDLLVAGFTRRCAVAFLGSLAGTATTFVLAMVLTDLLKLDGGDIPYVVPLLAQSAMRVDTRALFIGMMFIANSGALMDLSIDISVGCEEVQRHCPTISRGAMRKSAFAIGRGVLGTMATTLLLAYSGNYLSMLMYFAGQGTPILDVVNLKYVSSQLLNILVGSFGLVATAPFSALFASFFYTRGRHGNPADAQRVPEQEGLADAVLEP